MGISNVIGLINEYGVWVVVPFVVFGFILLKHSIDKHKQSIDKHEAQCKEWRTKYEAEQRELRAEQRELRGMVLDVIKGMARLEGKLEGKQQPTDNT